MCHTQSDVLAGTCSVAKQTVVALGNGESEFYGIVRAAAFGVQTCQLLCQFVYCCVSTSCADSSAAKDLHASQVAGRFDTSALMSCRCRMHCE